MIPNLIRYPKRTTGLPLPVAAEPEPRRFRTFAGTIEQGMDVIAPDGACLGRVERVEDDRIILAGMPGWEGSQYLLPMGLVAGIASGRVLIEDPASGAYGIAASH